MKRNAIINTLIGVAWLVGGIVALLDGMSLSLFGLIPIPTFLVIALGAIWTILGIRSFFSKPPAVEPVAYPEQYPPIQQTQTSPEQYPPQQHPPQEYPQMPQYAPRDPQGPPV